MWGSSSASWSASWVYCQVQQPWAGCLWLGFAWSLVKEGGSVVLSDVSLASNHRLHESCSLSLGVKALFYTQHDNSTTVFWNKYFQGPVLLHDGFLRRTARQCDCTELSKRSSNCIVSDWPMRHHCYRCGSQWSPWDRFGFFFVYTFALLVLLWWPGQGQSQDLSDLRAGFKDRISVFQQHILWATQVTKPHNYI